MISSRALIGSSPGCSNNPFVVWDVSCNSLGGDLQFVVAFLLENLRPFQQCFRARLNRITWVFESRSGQKAFAGPFVIDTGSHMHLEMMFSA
jgi:hypothetical protein